MRRRAMLQFIVEEARVGRAPSLKATIIAISVFDRGASFDQQADPVVISVPKGRYIPKFSLRNTEDLPGEAENAQGLAENNSLFVDPVIDFNPLQAARAEEWEDKRRGTTPTDA